MSANIFHSYKPDLWQDTELRFDAPARDVEPRAGERVLEALGSVEESKGLDGERGQLTLTTLRLTWQSHSRARINVSVGLGCVLTMAIKSATSRLRGGTTQALCLTCRVPAGASSASAPAGSSYEFIFTSLARASPRLFVTAQAAHRAYDSTRLYRDLKLRAAITQNRAVLLLPGERVFSRSEGVWNLSSDQGNLGVLTTTNLRFTWFATLAENFSVSVPYHQIVAIQRRETKNYTALVVEVSPRAGGLLLGFKIDPPEALMRALTELVALREAAIARPDFGVHIETDGDASDADASAVPVRSAAAAAVTEDAEIIEDSKADGGGRGRGDAFASYFADGGAASGADGTRHVVFSAQLGLAIEQPPAGLSIEQLWSAT